LSFFLNVSRVAACLTSVGRAFHKRGAAELKHELEDEYAVQTAQNLSQSAD